MRLVWSRQAKEDLWEIRVCSMRNWGMVKAVEYVERIADMAEALASDERSGTASEPDGAGLRRQIVASHSLWFRTLNGEVQIIRVLHQSRDATRVLDSD